MYVVHWHSPAFIAIHPWNLTPDNGGTLFPGIQRTTTKQTEEKNSKCLYFISSYEPTFAWSWELAWIWLAEMARARIIPRQTVRIAILGNVVFLLLAPLLLFFNQVGVLTASNFSFRRKFLCPMMPNRRICCCYAFYGSWLAATSFLDVSSFFSPCRRKSADLLPVLVTQHASQLAYPVRATTNLLIQLQSRSGPGIYLDVGLAATRKRCIKRWPISTG